MMGKGLFSAFLAGIVFQQAYAACVQCANDQPTATATHDNVWRGLSDAELESVVSFLNGRLNLTDPASATSKDNSIIQIDLLQPNKTDVLAYIDGNGSEPKRFARATVAFGTTKNLYLQNYMVGPLPASNITKLQPLTYPFNNGHDGKTNIHPLFVGGDSVQAILDFGTEVEDITTKLWNATFSDGTGFSLRTQFPLSEGDNKTIMWAEFVGAPTSGFDSQSVLPLGVSVRFDVTSRNWQDWNATTWFCLGKLYASTDEFRAAVFSPGFEKPLPNIDGEWTSTDRRGEPLPRDDQPPPVPVSEGSKRYAIDDQKQYVTWMDFSFYISVSANQGLSLFDVRYKGKRIIYELGLEEALTHYAGSSPVQSQTTYFDSLGGLGTSLVELINGYDCPNYATYLNTTITPPGAQVLQKDNAICLFEFDNGFPIRRHYHLAQNTTSVTKNIAFTVRTVSTVGNYDFLIEYDFFLDGGIEIHVRASGYISAAHYYGNEDYGFHIHDALSGSLHDHVFNFKLDLDVLGEKNSVQKVEFVPETVEYPWSNGKALNTMKATKSFITDESESSIDWAANDAALYSIVNKDTPNKFGEFPGYRIKRAAGTSHLTILNSSNIVNAGRFAEHDLYVTKAKDTEPHAADSFNAYDVPDPLIDFSRFLDGESLDQEDIVVWVNLGMHHIPHTGDLPNTMMSSAHSAIRIEPLNYLDNDPSVQTTQQIKVSHTNGSVETFGAQSAECSVDLSELNVLGS